MEGTTGKKVVTCNLLVADSTAAVFLQLVNDEVEHLQPGDICTLTGGAVLALGNTATSFALRVACALLCSLTGGSMHASGAATCLSRTAAREQTLSRLCQLRADTRKNGAGIFAMEPKGCVLRAGRKGVLSKVGEFCMVFAEHPNLSTILWVRLLVCSAS